MEVILDRTEETSISIDGDFEKNSYSKNLKLSFFQALAMNTKLSDEIKFIRGVLLPGAPNFVTLFLNLR